MLTDAEIKILAKIASLEAQLKLEPTKEEPITRHDPNLNRCARCHGPCTVEERRHGVVPYTRSVVIGSRSCPECHGVDFEECSRCNYKGYILKFGKETYDWACPACVSEMRYGRSGRGHKTIYTR